MAIFGWLTLIFWAILWAYWLISAFYAKKSVRSGVWWAWTIGIRLVIIAIVILGVYAGHAGPFLHSLSGLFGRSSLMVSGDLLRDAIGIVLCGGGIAFAIWARVYLGTNWGMPMSLREKPELVRSGPYKSVRHPIYSGFLLAIFGTGLVDGNMWFIVLVFAGIYFIYSAKTEEKMMMKQFPNEYPEYMKTSKMLIPFVF